MFNEIFPQLITIIISLCILWLEFFFEGKNSDATIAHKGEKKIFKGVRRRKNISKNKNKLIIYIVISLLIIISGFFSWQDIKSGKSDITNIKKNTESTHNKTSKISLDSDTLKTEFDTTLLNLKLINDSLASIKAKLVSLSDGLDSNFYSAQSKFQKLDSQSNNLLFKLPNFIYADVEITWSILKYSEVIDNQIKRDNIKNIEFHIPTATQSNYLITKDFPCYSVLYMGFKELLLLFSVENKSVRFIANVYPEFISPLNSIKQYYNQTDLSIYNNAEFIYNRAEKNLSFRLKNCPFELISNPKQKFNLFDIENSDFQFKINESSGIMGDINGDITPPYLFGTNGYFTREQGDYFSAKFNINFNGIISTSISTRNQFMAVKKIKINW